MSQILIVESEKALAEVWSRHLERNGHRVKVAFSSDDAVDFLSDTDVDVIILELMLDEGSVLAVADYAQYRQPDARVIFVTKTSFFSDGSIFSLSANTAAFLQGETSPEDLAAVVDHHCRR